MHYRLTFLTILLISFVKCGTPSPTQPEPEPERIDAIFDLPGNVQMAFIRIEPGTFIMGSEQPGDLDARPQHEVTLTKEFFLGKYEVTQLQWQSVMASTTRATPWMHNSAAAESFAIGDNFPATSMTWSGIQWFFEILNASDTTAIYRLPTEAEWEYTCRAGTITPYSFVENQNVEDFMWFDLNSTETYGDRTITHPHEIGLKKPNPWGLHDMHGNVTEFVDYWDRQYTTTPQIDPQPTKPPPPRRVIHNLYEGFPTFITRGGSYNSKQVECKSSSRIFFGGAAHGVLWELGRNDVGFRVVRQNK